MHLLSEWVSRSDLIRWSLRLDPNLTVSQYYKLPQWHMLKEAWMTLNLGLSNRLRSQRSWRKP